MTSASRPPRRTSGPVACWTACDDGDRYARHRTVIERDSPAGRAAALHAAGVAANADMHPAAAAALLREALAVLDTAGDTGGALRGRILLSLALAESKQGHVDA